MYKLCFYVPVDAADQVKEAIFAVGAGRIGDYDNCCWQVEGMGQFRPLSGSNPAVGEKNALNYVREMKIELVCEQKYIRAVINAMIEAHPYEEPAYQFWSVSTLADLEEKK